MYKIKRYFAGVVKEGKKVRWPSRKELFAAVSIVLVFTVIAALALALDDFIITKILAALDEAFKSTTEGGDSSSSSAAVRLISFIGRMR